MRPQENSIEPSFSSTPERDSENPQRESAPKLNLLPRTVTEQLDSSTESAERVSHDSNLSALRLSVPINQTQPKTLRPENRTSSDLEIPDHVLDTTEETTPKYIACDPVCGQTEDSDLGVLDQEENSLHNKQETDIIREGEVEVSCPNCGDLQNVPYNVLEFVCVNCNRKFSVGVSADRDGERHGEREGRSGMGRVLQSQARREPQQSSFIPPQYMALGIESTHPGYSIIGTSPLANPGDASQTFVKSVYDDPADSLSVEILTADQSNDSNNQSHMSYQTEPMPSGHRVPLERGPGTGLHFVMPQNQGSVVQNRQETPDNPGGHAPAQTPIEGTRPASDPLPMSPVQESPGTVVSEATIDDTSQPLIGQRRTILSLYTTRSLQNLIPNPAYNQAQDVQSVYGIEPRPILENDGQIELGIPSPASNDLGNNEENADDQGVIMGQGNDSGTSSGMGSEGTGSLGSSHESLQDTVAMGTSMVSRSTSEDTDSGMVENGNQEGVEGEGQEGGDEVRERGTRVGTDLEVALSHTKTSNDYSARAITPNNNRFTESYYCVYWRTNSSNYF